MPSTILSLFPSNLFLTTIEKNTDQLKENKIFHPTNNNVSGEIKTDFRSLERFPRIKKILLDEFKKFMRELDYDCDFKISTSWFVSIERGQEGHSHIHKNSFYSGIYYYDEYDDDSAGIEFDSPISSLLDYHIAPKSFTSTTSVSTVIQPQKNLLILFPSYLRHKIKKHNGEKTRYSLAFNIVPIGKYGVGDSSYNTSW